MAFEIRTKSKVEKFNKYSGFSFDRYDYTHSLFYNGENLILRTEREINGNKKTSTRSNMEEDDFDLIEKLFHGLELECFQFDGTPTFQYEEERIHLTSPHCVRTDDDVYEI